MDELIYLFKLIADELHNANEKLNNIMDGVESINNHIQEIDISTNMSNDSLLDIKYDMMDIKDSIETLSDSDY